MATRFRDLDLDFTAHPKTLDISIKKDAEAIKRSIRNLVQFSRGDKPFHPEIASGVRDLLFEPLTTITSIRIQQEITRIIQDYEPRALVNSVDVRLNTSEDGYNISVVFNIRNVLEPSILGFSLQRLR